ncbi:uncharacterized protein P884DRAFT_273920 [Thermothelomyces heterothallicus CBS 202.75]|uniref:uncharacterized protein n=1 Tax=Thermothelomyces heterothallicus CBS 202.75 TaxID=1149848 RepID=UPI0037424CEF
MKSVISAGLIAALLCSTTAIAGSTPLKTARGSNRVTCYVEIDHTKIGGQDLDHHKHGHKHGHKHKLETSRTISIYGWSFLWNYIITDDCPKITAHLSSLIPLLGHDHHGVKCRVEIGWNPGNAAHEKLHGTAPGYHDSTLEQYNHSAGTQSSWDYAGHGEIDFLTLPAKMEWPLSASFDRPNQLVKSGELGAKYETTTIDATNTFKVSPTMVRFLQHTADHPALDSRWPRQRFLPVLGS